MGTAGARGPTAAGAGMLKNLLAHTSKYTLGTLLVTLAGFISFPIFTRIFSVNEYGILSLIATTLLLGVGVAKCGMQHAIVRFYGEVRAGKRDVSEAGFLSTVVLGMGMLGLGVTVVWVLAGGFIPAHWWEDERVRSLLLLTCVLVVVRVIDSGLLNVLRAQERSGAYSIYSVARRYLTLGLILLTVFFVLPGLRGFYAATIAAEIVAVVLLGAWLFRTKPIRWGVFSTPLFRAMLAFGIPMAAYEVSGIIFSFGDRYIIQFMLGGAALGAYSAAYNLCEYVNSIMIESFSLALIPMFVRSWEEQGSAPTRRFVEESLHFYILVTAGVVAGLAAVGGDLLRLLASEKYDAGAEVVSYVVAGMALGGVSSLLSAGLYIHKKTGVLMLLVAAATALNLVLNVMLIPPFGIKGAAIATLVSYAVLALLMLAVSRRRFPITVPWLQTGKFVLLATLMYFSVQQVRIDVPVAKLLVQIALGAAVYGILVVVCDRRSRAIATDTAARFSVLGAKS